MISRFALIALLSAAQLASALTDPVKTETGLVSGVAGSNPSIQVYKGIPYAAPPVGDLRWRAPQPAAPWQGIRAAASFGNSCMQQSYKPEPVIADVKAGKSPWGPEFYAWRQPLSEDCLYLNVWSSAKSAGAKLPVLVYIHGGGFQQGSGAVDIYDGEGLASKGLVVVTINYRLGVFGFFAHPELTKESDHHVSGNYGLLDQIAALAWVHKNIAAFGGDPDKVTINGQSAGAHSINYLVATPLTHGLIQRAISESGGMFIHSVPGDTTGLSSGRTAFLKDAEERGVKYAQAHNAASIAELRARPAAELTGQGATTAPIIDGYVLPTDVYTIFATGKQNDIPMIVGWNSGDGTPFANNSGLPATVAGFAEAAQKKFGPMADDFLKAFPVKTDADAVKARAAVSRDQMFGWSSRTWGRLQAKTGKSKIYLFYWDHVPPVAPETEPFGAFHSSEITYAQNNLKTWNLPWTPVDRKLADAMSSYWVNFAKTGDPNAGGLPAWPNFDPKNEQSMHFGDTPSVIPTPLKPELDFFDRWYAGPQK